MDNVDVDEPKNGHIDFSDFLIASVTTERKHILDYCKAAYEILFKNEHESIEVSDLIEILCISKVMKPDFIR
jgi:Ca2+-binding EF-hand superfamily protein|tara:strand:- start:326 stop:541 length:216 start_codon:yes stop_codon:yes gene_type:complete